MSVYPSVYKLNLDIELAYPIEVIAYILRKVVTFGFLLLFWYLMSTGNKGTFEINQILSYFLISQAVGDLTFSSGGRFGRLIQSDIRRGKLSVTLIRPVDTLRYLFVSFMGARTSVTVLGLLYLIAGIIVYPPNNPISYLLFPIFLIFTTITGIAYNIFLGILAFYTPESGSLRSIFEHIQSVLSGGLVPLTYFPPLLKAIVTYSPFPILAFSPTWVLQSGGLNAETLKLFLLAIFWSLTLLYLVTSLWKKALKNYDGAGI